MVAIQITPFMINRIKAKPEIKINPKAIISLATLYNFVPDNKPSAIPNNITQIKITHSTFTRIDFF